MRRILLLGMVIIAIDCLHPFMSHANDSTTVHSAIVESNEHATSHRNTYAVMKAMYEANGRHFQDPRAPRFLFLDRKGRVALGIGGYAKVTTSFGLAGIADNIDFVTATIPVPSQPDMRSKFQMDASTSRLFFKLVGRNTTVGDFTVYIEGDFRGMNVGYYGMRLRQAYIELWRFKVGRGWSTFCDVAAIPPTIDFQGPSGSIIAMSTMLQYIKPIGKHWSIAYAVEMPSATYTTHPHYNATIHQRVPDLPSYYQYEWDNGASHIRLSNLLRMLSYRNLISESNKIVVCWATQLSGMIKMSPHFTLYYQGSYGKGYASYLNDLSGYGYDLIPAERNGAMTAPYAIGLTGGVQYTIKQGLFLSAAYSQCRLLNDKNLSDEAYHYGQYVVANAFYTPFNNCQIGIEYLYGNRHNRDNGSGNAHRINAMIQYNF